MSKDMDQNTPSSNKLMKACIGAFGLAAVLLVLVILPAEYGIDPTGFGKITGLSNLATPARVIEVPDPLGGNQALREVQIPEFGEPTPLPNPAVFQDQPEAPQTRTMQIVIPADAETEIKVKITEAKVFMFSWEVDQGTLYVDFHGHDPSFGPDFFVRYKEEDEGTGGNGSVTAAFSGEHGWYWLNYNEFDVTVTLTVTGYFDEIIDYGVF
jgi:hypothetical protein